MDRAFLVRPCRRCCGAINLDHRNDCFHHRKAIHFLDVLLIVSSRFVFDRESDQCSPAQFALSELELRCGGATTDSLRRSDIRGERVGAILIMQLGLRSLDLDHPIQLRIVGPLRVQSMHHLPRALGVRSRSIEVIALQIRQHRVE